MRDLALKIVRHAFKGKKDIGGQDYILHLKRVEESLENKSEEIRTVALLHDLLEDCPEWNEDVLRCFFPKIVVDSVVTLTKGKSEKYEDYITRVSESGWATIVKIADLQDNMNVARLNEITDKDVIRLKKYLSAYKILTG